MFIATIVLGSLLALVFAGAGGAKLAGAPMMRESARHLGMPFPAYRWIGAAEVAGAAGIIVGLWHIGLGEVNLSVLAAACLSVLMIGAASAHLRAGDPPAQWTPAATFALLLVAFIGLRIASS